jgi:hypothetical protein
MHDASLEYSIPETWYSWKMRIVQLPNSTDEKVTFKAVLLVDFFLFPS